MVNPALPVGDGAHGGIQKGFVLEFGGT